MIAHSARHYKYSVEIISEYGWLGISDIGRKANASLFIAIQHSDDPSVMESFFPLLEKSAHKGESDLKDMANMKDRILVYNQRPQIYGTQWNFSEGQTTLFPIENPNNINEKRKSVGLEPLSSEQIKFAATSYD